MWSASRLVSRPRTSSYKTSKPRFPHFVSCRHPRTQSATADRGSKLGVGTGRTRGIAEAKSPVRGPAPQHDVHGAGGVGGVGAVEEGQPLSLLTNIPRSSCLVPTPKQAPWGGTHMRSSFLAARQPQLRTSRARVEVRPDGWHPSVTLRLCFHMDFKPFTLRTGPILASLYSASRGFPLTMNRWRQCGGPLGFWRP